MKIGIIGAGRIGGTLGQLWSASGHRALMLFAGDDAEGKATVRALGEEIGLEMEDAGGLANAGLLEAPAALWIQLAFRGGLGRNFAFALLRK